MTTVDEIVKLYRIREKQMGPDLARMRKILEMYNGDFAVPLPELAKDEQSAVANFLAVGLDQNSMRVADPTPNVTVPALKAMKKWEDKAREQRRAVLGHFESQGIKRKMRRRARHLLGYGTAPVLIRPHQGVATWELRSPLRTFAAACNDPDELHPDDTIFTVGRRWDWLCDRYPMACGAVMSGPDPSPDDVFEVLEYVDCEEWVTVLLGRQNLHGTGHLAPYVELERIPNRIGMCPAVIPGRISLDTTRGQFDGITGMYMEMARLMSLSIIATQKGIIRDEWLVAHPNEEPEIVSTPDPYDGRPGIVKGGQLIARDVDPQFQTSQTMQLIDRAIRETAGVPTEFGGSSSSGTRTARRGAQLLSAAIDFPVAEAQEVLAQSLECEARVMIATEKAYFGSMPRSFHVRWKGAQGRSEFVPSEMWADLTDVQVRYSFPGVDTNSLVIEAGQRIGQGTMSKRKFMEVDPFVDDVETELDRVKQERVDDAFLTSIQTLAANPEGPWQPVDFARFTELVRSNQMEMYEAAQKVQEEAQARQAAAAAPADPAAQPGLSLPGQGVEVPPTIAGPSDGQSGLNQLLMSLRGPQMMPASQQAVPV